MFLLVDLGNYRLVNPRFSKSRFDPETLLNFREWQTPDSGHQFTSSEDSPFFPKRKFNQSCLILKIKVNFQDLG